MSPLFGKKERGQTIAVLDIESTSAGAALVRIAPKEAPRLFAQSRISLPLTAAPSAHTLLHGLEDAAHETLSHSAEVAARLRAQGVAAGTVDRVAIFLHAPWVSIDISNSAKPVIEPLEGIRSRFAKNAASLFAAPASFHAFATSAAPILHGTFNAAPDALVCTVHGALAELSLIQNGALVGHATVPGGSHAIIRTLKSHAGLSEAEARSALVLAAVTGHAELSEALDASLSHFARELSAAAGALLAAAGEGAQRVFVLSSDGGAEWFARGMSEHPAVNALFAPGSTIRALSGVHFARHLSAHPHTPDAPLTIEALFADARFGS